MASKKYLSLEEAAQLLGIKTEEVIRLRERGDLRGFADRGTWKFKSDDVEEAKRRRTPDSNPEVPLFGDDSESNALDDDDELGRQATIIRKSGNTSDSDVRLLMNEDLRGQLTGSSHEMPIIKPGSDSDVRLVGTSTEKPVLSGSDSDVKLIKPKAGEKSGIKKDSDSDVRLATPAGSGLRLAQSDSDVRLAGPVAAPGSDSDVKLVEGGLPTDAAGNVFDLDAGDSVLLDDESAVSLENDSGIRLTGDSGIRLAGDSGIQLQQPADSGILLERPGESGFRLGGADDSAITLADDSGVKVTGSGKLAGRSSPRLPKSPLSEDDDPLSRTGPLVLRGEDAKRTDPEVPLLAGDDDDLMPKLKSNFDPPTDAEASVVMLDDDDLDATAATLPRKKGKSLNDTDLEDGGFDLGESGDTAAEDFESLDDEEVDDSEAVEVFETEDSDFDENFSEGASAADFAVPGSRIAISTQRDWETWVVVVSMLSTVVMGIGAVAAVDLLRVVFANGGPSVAGGVIDRFGALFK